MKATYMISQGNTFLGYYSASRPTIIVSDLTEAYVADVEAMEAQREATEAMFEREMGYAVRMEVRLVR